MLVTIMSKSHDLLFEKQIYIQAQERLELIQESFDFINLIASIRNQILRIPCLKRCLYKTRCSKIYSKIDLKIEEENKPNYLFICEYSE